MRGKGRKGSGVEGKDGLNDERGGGDWICAERLHGEECGAYNPKVYCLEIKSNQGLWILGIMVSEAQTLERYIMSAHGRYGIAGI